jgi:exosome complex RNA-binding protein Csl4
MKNAIKKSDIKETLDVMMERGDIFAGCPICKEYLTYNEYNLCYCNKCKKIEFKDILYYPGTSKDNN